MQMANLDNKSKYEKIMNEYDNVYGFDIGGVTLSTKQAASKKKVMRNAVNGELIIKKR